PVRRVAEIFQQALIDHDEILGDPPPLVFFNDFGDNALQFIGYFWINATSERDLRKIRSDVRFSLYELLEAEDIVIAFPQRDVHLDGEITIRRPPEPVAVESGESAGLEPAPPAEQG
ncbi:MAG TPA: mechanosensitive ion channel protein, partial [Gammaproteobacteria bacterium]|nr:mechanosensitive ion channel protein [Gammaproteobacteria bacterium]